jgi:predicted NAD-dependent protein-ADP-ribosyltransferase YbiA (DUF1768 family)
MSKNLEELKDILNKYENNPEYNNWSMNIKTKQNRIILVKNFQEKPSDEEMKKQLKKFNKKNNSEYSMKNVFLKKIQKEIKPISMMNEKEEKDEKEEIELENQQSIGIYDSNMTLSPLSPFYQNTIVIDNISFPSIEMYVIFNRIMNTGVSSNYEKTKYMRKTSFENAIQMLRDENGNFVDINRAFEIYEQYNGTSIEILSDLLATIGAKKKFQNANLRNILLMTMDRKILYISENTILGIWNGVGLNRMGKILEKIRENYRKEIHVGIIKYNNVNIKSLKHMMENDPFIQSWTDMRLNDMCNTVYLVQKYLKHIGKSEENMNENFVEKVLNIIYSDCNNLFAKCNIPEPTDDFIAKVSVCNGVFPKSSLKEYMPEIIEIQNQIIEADINFWGMGGSNKNIPAYNNLSSFLEKQKQDLENYMLENKDVNDIEEFKRNQNDELTLFINQKEFRKEENLDDKFRKKWIKFRNKLNMVSQEYKDELAKINKDYNKESKELSEEGKKKLKLKYKKLKKNLALKMNIMTDEEKKNKIDEFNKKQEEELKMIYGKGGPKKTKEDIENHEKYIKSLKEKKSELEKIRKQTLSGRKNMVKNIAQIYWNKIFSMLCFIIVNLQGKIDGVNSQALRQMIASSRLAVSNNIGTCKNSDLKISDDFENCIFSSLTNILTMLQNIKKQFSIQVPLSEKDLILSVNILLDKEYKTKELFGKKSDNKEGKEETEGKVFESQEKESDDESDNLDDQLDEQEDDDYEDENDNFEEDYDMNDENSSEFGFESNDKDIIVVKAILEEIGKNNVEDIDNLARYLLECINIVKNFHMSDKVKMSRINFFATHN